MKTYKVYKHTAPNGKVYIGITQQDVDKRWKRGLGYQDNPHFSHAIQKYGWDNFKHEVLLDSLTKEEAEENEIRLIEEYNSTDRNNGYNIARGGNTTTPTEESRNKASLSMVGFWSDTENRKKMSRAMLGVKRTDEARKRISIAQKERFKNKEERIRISERQKGTRRSEVAKKRTSETLKAFYSNPKNMAIYKKAHEGVNRKTHAKKVMCVETGEIFEAVVDAEKRSGVDHRNIISVCKGKRKRAGGFTWAYVI